MGAMGRLVASLGSLEALLVGLASNGSEQFALCLEFNLHVSIW